MNEKSFKILIVGEPNVGKSTLLNKLIGKRNAIVLDESGVTRDTKIIKKIFRGYNVEFIDTPGITDFLKFDKIFNIKKKLKKISKNEVNELIDENLIDEKVNFQSNQKKIQNKVKNKKIFFKGNKNENNEDEKFSIQNLAQINAMRFINEANLILFMIDGTKEISRNIIESFNSLRKKNKDLIFVINKCDCKKMSEIDSYSIGLMNNPIVISAEHKIGINDLEDEIFQKILNFFVELKEVKKNYEIKIQNEDNYSNLNENLNENGKIKNENFENNNLNNFNEKFFSEEEKKPINIVILGKPNVGKSTLVNALIKEDIQLVLDVPGVTRDTAEFTFEKNGIKFIITDTAGIRKKSKINSNIEKISASKAIQSMNFAEVVVIMIDAKELEKENEENFLSQDITLATMAAEEGRAVVIALNKFDKIKEQKKLLSLLNAKIKNKLSQLGGLKIVPISALNKTGLNELLSEIKNVYESWNKKISTSKLNTWLRETVSSFPPPAEANRRSKLKYITMGHTRPPFFIIFCTRKVQIPEQYEKFLINKIREKFRLFGVPIRISFREQKNPFHEKR